eukprot:CAMPEP_0196806844 /NCGR_PEP_ID=MMETSP1362-20130617/6773_1 /TAXON_ID=163516 /ORGANISM="Leptocylindrus danicus, Strain CCMP1856" /LENGTH=311 /DNA_ID=CAMNT_0042180513 /DNA_START=87 /DNA_END=1022 /DNA_ORIENTATION=+
MMMSTTNKRDGYKYGKVNTSDEADANSNNFIDESGLIERPDATALPVATAVPMVEVTAPATLPEGYTFQATAAGRSFNVRVPTGGVEKGQRFSVPMPSEDDDFAAVCASRISVPVGHWKDGICSCFRFGICHAWLWMTCCCPLLATAQVQTRLNLNFCGNEKSGRATNPSGWKGENMAIHLSITIIFLVVYFRNLFYVMPLLQKVVELGTEDPTSPEIADLEEELESYQQMIRISAYAFGIYAFVVFYRTRKAIRRRYAIPQEICCEDAVCIACCRCCAVAQYGRHTADYERHRSVCFSTTGVPEQHPPLV